MKFLGIITTYIALSVGLTAEAHTNICIHKHQNKKIIRDDPRLGKNTESLQSSSNHHKMQHGFILSEDDSFASHLVANGPHGWQTSINGELTIPDESELSFYLERKKENELARSSYFLFQAQDLSLIDLEAGMELHGHIVESKKGHYEPSNKIVSSVIFSVHKVLVNIPNPFFGVQENAKSTSIDIKN